MRRRWFVSRRSDVRWAEGRWRKPLPSLSFACCRCVRACNLGTERRQSMILKPVRPGAALALSDREARRPRELRDKDALKQMLEDEVKELGGLQDRLMAGKRHAVLVIFQGRDASGKDGAIKQVFDGCNPQGCRVT